MINEETRIGTFLENLQEQSIKFVDLRFTDLKGKEQHMTLRSTHIDTHFLEQGRGFDGSSIAGWKSIDTSDMLLMPDIERVTMDPFFHDKTAIVRCDVYDPVLMRPYTRDPRSVAKKAEAFLAGTDIADKVFFGPEPEFFIFDDVRWHNSMQSCGYQIDSKEASWNSSTKYPEGNLGHRPSIKGGYFPVPPIDSSQDIRSMMCFMLEKFGQVIELHHHEVATGNQNEIAVRYNTLTQKADELQELKYVVQNVAQSYGKTATFMPKPLYGDNGNGMHCHVSLQKDGVNIFAGDHYAGLSETALFFIGGIIHHARSLNAFTNPSTNSYKRLVPGFEAPVMLAYSARNRSAAIRIPHVNDPKAKRIEIRFPDPMANPYLCFSAIMLAGLDGIQKHMHPGDPMDKNLYDLSPQIREDIPTVCSSLDQALGALEADYDYLLQGQVFSQDTIEAYIALKREEIKRVALTPHPAEFELYYSD